MKKTLRLMSLLICAAMILTLGACGKAGGASSELNASESDDGMLIGFDDDSAVQGTASGTQSQSKNPTGSNAQHGGDTTNYGGTEIKNEVVFNKKDPFADIPSRLRGTTVKFATWGDESSEVYRKVIEGFTKKTGIKVQFIEYSQYTYQESVTASIVNKDAPDVAIAGTFPSCFSMFQPIDNLIDTKDEFWDPTIMEYSRINGKTYAVNSVESSWTPGMLVYYNKALFNNNGITSPEEYYKAGKWSWENYEKCAKAISDLGSGYVGTLPGHIALCLNRGLGNPSVKYDTKKAQFTNNLKNAAEGYRYTFSLIDKGICAPYGDSASFTLGKVGLVINDPFGSKYNGYYKDMKDSELGILPLPETYKGKKVNNAIANGYRGYGIAKGAKNPEAAAYFLRYFLDYKYYEEAGVNIFKGKSTAKTYFDIMDKYYRLNSNRVIDLAGQIWDGFESKFDSYVLKTSSAQVETVISQHANEMDSYVKNANAVINSLK